MTRTSRAGRKAATVAARTLFPQRARSALNRRLVTSTRARAVLRRLPPHVQERLRSAAHERLGTGSAANRQGRAWQPPRGPALEPREVTFCLPDSLDYGHAYAVTQTRYVPLLSRQPSGTDPG